MVKMRMRVVVMYVAIAAVCLYVVPACLLFVFQSRLVYFPQREIITTPRDMKLTYEAVYFQTSDHLRLSGWYVPVENPRAVILFCHGNAGNISDRLQSIDFFSRLGLSTFIFDYRGFGLSEGRPTERGTYADAEAAWIYLIDGKGLRADSIVIYGESLGGAIAAWLARKHTPAALIVQSAFTSVPDLASELYPLYPVRWLSRFEYGTLKYIRTVKSPVMVIHSRDDEIVPYSHGSRLYRDANTPKEFLEIRGDHNAGFVISEREYMSGLDRFVSSYVKR